MINVNILDVESRSRHFWSHEVTPPTIYYAAIELGIKHDEIVHGSYIALEQIRAQGCLWYATQLRLLDTAVQCV